MRKGYIFYSGVSHVFSPHILSSHLLHSSERKADLTAVREEGEEEGRENLGCERDGDETFKSK